MRGNANCFVTADENPLPNALPNAPPVAQASAAPPSNYDIFSSLNQTQGTGQPASSQTVSAAPPSDPFASLVSAEKSRVATPSSTGAAQNPPSSSLLDLGGLDQRASAPSSTTKTTGEDGEWSFTSALPESSGLPNLSQVQVLNSALRVEFVSRRVSGNAQQIYVVALFSNATNQPLSELHFQVAVEKVRCPPFNGELRVTDCM